MKNPLNNRLITRAVNLLLVVLLASGLAACISDRNGRSMPARPDERQNPAPPAPITGQKEGPREGVDPDRKPDQQQPARQQPETPQITGERPRPVQIARSTPSKLPPPKSSVEKLQGYAVPAEYLFVRSQHFSRGVVSVTLPLSYEEHPDRTYPLVIAFGGAGECVRAPRDGSLAWIDYYKTDEAVKALEDNHLTGKDFRGLALPAEIAGFNRRLKSHSYRGVILVCPYSPPLSTHNGLENPGYEKFIVEELLPQLKKRYRIAPASVGVDGVSMGGARSMYFGFKYPELFQSIGAVQGAFGPYFPMYKELIKENLDLLKHRSIQLVTSDKDFCARSVERMHKLLVKNSIPHRMLRLTGPHDYIFNQGPGALALLVFHNEALGRPPVGPVR